MLTDNCWIDQLIRPQFSFKQASAPPAWTSVVPTISRPLAEIANTDVF